MAKALQKVSVRTAILAGFGALLLMIGVSLSVIWLQGRTLEANHEKLRHESLPSIDALHNLNAAAQFLVQAVSYAAMVDVLQGLGRRTLERDGASRDIAALERRSKLAHAGLRPGIPADVLPRIFDPLFTTGNFGVGLGLALVRQIVQQHRRSVTVERNGAPGATFMLRLPVDSSDELPREKAA